MQRPPLYEDHFIVLQGRFHSSWELVAIYIYKRGSAALDKYILVAVTACCSFAIPLLQILVGPEVVFEGRTPSLTTTTTWLCAVS